jgi:transcriptional regulator with XRE-family HTH domain
MIIMMNKRIKNISKNIGKRVKIERIKQDISQERLAELSDLHRSTLGLIENGKISPTLDSIAKIAGALGVSLSEIVDFDF